MPAKRTSSNAAELRKILGFPFAVFTTGVLSVAGFCSVFILHLGR
jgi:hypothetical protein